MLDMSVDFVWTGYHWRSRSQLRVSVDDVRDSLHIISNLSTAEVVHLSLRGVRTTQHDVSSLPMKGYVYNMRMHSHKRVRTYVYARMRA